MSAELQSLLMTGTDALAAAGDALMGAVQGALRNAAGQWTLSAQQGQYVGAVSELVAATLQTKGMEDQSRILDTFNRELTDLAALFYLVAIMSAVTATAVYGSYRRCLYLLVGPAFFYFMINERIEANGTQLRIGDDIIQNSPQEQRSFLSFIGQEDNSDVGGGFHRVSRVYGVFDSLVSAVVQDIVAVILDTQNREHTRRVARERALAYVLQSRGDNPGFVRLVSAVIFGECAEVIQGFMNLGKKLRAAQRSGTPLPGYEEERNRIMRKWEGGEGGDGRRGQVAIDQQLRTYLARYLGGDPVDYPANASCKEAWQWLVDLAKLIAEEKLRPEDYIGPNVRADNDTNWNQVMQDVRSALEAGPTGEGNAGRMLAVYVLKNTMGHATHWAMTQQLFSRVPFSQQKFDGIFNKLHYAEGQGGFMRIMYFAGTVKYIQGMLLYLLSVGFPFFAALLILPGRATSFLVWGGLWVWVKSWDIGFALVHVARDIMWQFVRQGINRENIRVDDALPETFFSVMYNNDPLATQNTYWQIIGLLTVSVPFLTAHCCLGATNLFDAFKLSIDQTANRFGQQRINETRRSIATEAEMRYRQSQYEAERQAIVADLQRPLFDRDGNRIETPNEAEIQSRAFLRGQAAGNYAMLSPEVMADTGLLAAATGRRMAYAQGSGAGIVRAEMGIRLSHYFQNRSATGAANFLPFTDMISGHRGDQSRPGVSFPSGGFSGHGVPVNVGGE